MYDNKMSKQKTSATKSTSKTVSKSSKRGELALSFSNKFKDWELNGRYKCEKLLGKGSYGEVAQAI